MSTKRPRLDRDAEALLGNLMATPVGRRWLLKAGLGSAAAIAAAHLPALSRSAPAPGRQPGRASRSARRRQPAPTTNRTLQFALGPAMDGVANLTLVSNGVRMPLVAHTSASRAAPSQGGVFAAANLNALDALRPGHAAASRPRHAGLGVRHARQRPGGRVPDVARPELTTLAMARLAASSGNGLRSMLGSNARLQYARPHRRAGHRPRARCADGLGR